MWYIMFLATFEQVTSEKFIADKNGEMPFIGKVVAGKSKATLFNGTVFKQQQYKPKRAYLCQNEQVTLADGRKVWNVDIIAEVSAIEIPALRGELGAPMLNLPEVEENNDVLQNAHEEETV